MARKVAKLKPQVYIDPRPAEYFKPYYRYVQEHRIGPILELARLLIIPPTLLLYRVRPFDTGNVPSSGPAIIAPNHFSTLDHFFVAMYLRRRVNFMAKSQLFKGLLAPVLKLVGAFPVRRGQRDLDSLETALAVLRRGGVVVIYPEGGRSRSTRLGKEAKPGVGYLALASGAPVVPVAIHGSQYARNWKYLHFPKIRVKYGKPVCYRAENPEQVSRREVQQAVADDVLRRIHGLWYELDNSRAELGPLTLPASVAGEARARLERFRPAVPRLGTLAARERLRSAHPRALLREPAQRARAAASRTLLLGGRSQTKRPSGASKRSSNR